MVTVLSGFQSNPRELDTLCQTFKKLCGTGGTVRDNLIEIQRAIQSTPDNAKRVQATIGAYFDFIEAEGEAFRLLFESDMNVEPAVRERLNRMTYDCAAAVSAVISLDTGLPQEAAMLLGVGLIGSAQVTARHWLERDSKLSREQAQALATNKIGRAHV